MIRVFLSGAHKKRTPLSYPALWPLFDGHITRVDRPEAADLYVFAHVLDVQNAPQALVEDWRRRQIPVVILSEEPFWDTIWAGRPLEPLIYVDTHYGALPVHQLGHQTSDIYRFTQLPYYVLTDHRFANAYTYRFARNAARSVADWRAALAAAPLDLGFMFERRPEAYHDVRWPTGDIIGLCAWRTALAEACTGPKVQRWGQSWQGGISRFELTTDWHLDKLTRLDGETRVLGALENTHHPDYITEKLFDAYACGAVPLYYASPGHRVHDLGLPPASWINLYDMTPQDAANRVMAYRTSPRTAPALKEANALLADRFGDTGLWVQERARLGQAVRAALTALL